LLSTALIGSIEKYLQTKTTELISTGISSLANIATTTTTATNATIYK
jgi:hypothetical protein